MNSAPYVPVTAEWISLEARLWHLPLSEEQAAESLEYLNVLEKWNRKVNLTAVRTPQEAVRLHFLESFFAARHLPAGYTRVVDVGSGAGFPGLAMKIVRPELRLVLLDSRRKKVLFQKEVIRRLRLSHVTALPLRLQEGAFFLEQADAVCWRALRIEGEDLKFLFSHTPASCLYLCFQGEAERVERALEGCELTRIPIPGSRARTLLLARRPRR